LNFEYFFARRITFNYQRSISGFVVKLAVISIAIAVATMEISLSLVRGFEIEIQNKVVGFGSHIQVGNYLGDFDNEVTPLPKNEEFVKQVDSLEEVASISPYVNRWGMLRSKAGLEGVMIKGVDSSYDWSFFHSMLIEGEIPNIFGKKPEKGVYDALISKKQAQLLDLEVGDKVRFFAFNDPPKMRPLRVSGIYETGMEEFDVFIVLTDMHLVQNLWRWNDNQVAGFEINLHTLENLSTTTDYVNELIPFQYEAKSIQEIYPEIFDWLSLQHQNVWFILLLMVTIAVINMTSVVLILIIERTRTIGVLKAIGLSAGRIQRIFVWNAFFFIIIGVLIGNLLGLGLLASQDYFHWLKVSQENYFIKEVPVSWVWMKFLWVNLGVIMTCTIFMLLPTAVISRISPVQAIRFE